MAHAVLYNTTSKTAHAELERINYTLKFIEDFAGYITPNRSTMHILHTQKVHSIVMMELRQILDTLCDITDLQDALKTVQDPTATRAATIPDIFPKFKDYMLRNLPRTVANTPVVDYRTNDMYWCMQTEAFLESDDAYCRGSFVVSMMPGADEPADPIEDPVNKASNIRLGGANVRVSTNTWVYVDSGAYVHSCFLAVKEVCGILAQDVYPRVRESPVPVPAMFPPFVAM